MGRAREATAVALPPERALRLWLDSSRWPTFVDGFGRLRRRQESWPAPGSTAVWESKPGGRGVVTEKVVELDPAGRVVVELFEERLRGRQTAAFDADGDGSAVRVELDYALVRFGPLAPLADVLFIRRALRDSIARTLRRFAIEAAEEAALGETRPR